MSTVYAVSYISDHITFVLCYRSPFPGIFNSVGEYNVISSHFSSTHHKISYVGLRPIVSTECIITHSMEIFYINYFTSHGLDLRCCLEPSKKCTCLISPLSTIFIYIIRSVSKVSKSWWIFRRWVHSSKSF